MEQQSFSFSMLMDIIVRRIKLLAILAFIAIVGAVIFSSPFFITPKYKSTAIVYPINLKSYGNESLTEQLLQLFQSTDIRDSVIEKFDLVNVYKLNPTSSGFKHNLYNEYLDHVVVSKTNYESVKIEVLDENPIRAQQIANEIIFQLNSKARRLKKKEAQEKLELASGMLEYQRNYLDSINYQLSNLREGNGLLDYQIQTERVTEGYMKMLGQTGVNKENIAEVRKMLQDLKNKGGLFMALTQMSELGHEQYNELFIEYQQVLKELKQEYSYTDVIVNPEVADKKAYPVRWLIVASTTLSVLLFAMFLLLMFDKRWQKA
jgi:capsular polysaccharide biosynthesis protein